MAVNFSYKNSGLKGGAYSNPQQVVNKEFEMYQKKQIQFQNQIDKSVSGISAKNALERASQEQLFAAQNAEQRTQFDKVAGIKETGYGTFDQNMNNFFDGQTQKYFEIKGRIADGSISQIEGNRALSYLNQQVVDFKSAVVPIMTQAKGLQEALKIPPGQPGSISSRVPTEQQKVLLDLIQGGNVNIVDSNGQLMLFKPGKEGSESAMLNVTELINLEANGQEYYKTVPDISESLKTAYKNVLTPGGKDNADFIMFETKRVGDQDVTVKYMTTEQRQEAAQAMVNANQFKGILDDEDRMKTVWADLMGKDTDWMNVEGATAEETEANIKKQRDEASIWMANKAIEDNAAAEGVKMAVGRTKYKAPTAGKASKETLTNQAREERYNVYSEKADVLAKGNPEEVALALSEINPVGKTYAVVDESYVLGMMSEENNEKYSKLKTDEEKSKFAKELADKNKMPIGSIIDEQGDIIPNTNTAAGIRAALASEGSINLDQQTIYSKRRSQAADQAYKSIEPKPSSDKKFFDYNGRRYLNPAYKEPGVNDNQPSKSFTKNIPPQQGGTSIVKP
tara:strand:- start:2880 stop:4577 length:1698 start_codon:yes stop_codon:yes gene_type:complete